MVVVREPEDVDGRMKVVAKGMSRLCRALCWPSPNGQIRTVGTELPAHIIRIPTIRRLSRPTLDKGMHSKLKRGLDLDTVLMKKENTCTT